MKLPIRIPYATRFALGAVCACLDEAPRIGRLFARGALALQNRDRTGGFADGYDAVADRLHPSRWTVVDGALTRRAGH